jgi:2-keto-3-deoxy-L-rhamnonate aldolase RhmA
MKENSIRRAVREGRAALGTGLKEFASRGIPWIIEASGFDCCTIDHEHGAFDFETIADLAGWFQATSVSPIVREAKYPSIGNRGISGQGMHTGYKNYGARH